MQEYFRVIHNNKIYDKLTFRDMLEKLKDVHGTNSYDRNLYNITVEKIRVLPDSELPEYDYGEIMR